MKVKEIMVQPVITAREDATLEEVARLILDNNIGCVPIVNLKGKLSGLITESDFAAKEKGLPFSTFHAPQVLGHWLSTEGVERIYEAAKNMRAKEIMTHQVITLSEEDSMETVIELMLKHDVNRIPVVRDEAPVGIIARHDLLKLVVKKNPK